MFLHIYKDKLAFIGMSDLFLKTVFERFFICLVFRLKSDKINDLMNKDFMFKYLAGPYKVPGLSLIYKVCASVLEVDNI